MRISDQHVEALLSYFTDVDDHHRRLTRLQATGDLIGFNALLAATVLELLGRRLPPDDRSADITTWVAMTRAHLIRQGEADSVPDPDAAEALLRTLSGLESCYAELDPLLQIETQYLLMRAFRTELDLDDAAFGNVLAAARLAAETVQPQ